MALLHPSYYIQTAVFFATAALLGLWPDYGFGVLGAVWFVSLLLPGLRCITERKRLAAAGDLSEIV